MGGTRPCAERSTEPSPPAFPSSRLLLQASRGVGHERHLDRAGLLGLVRRSLGWGPVAAAPSQPQVEYLEDEDGVIYLD